MVSMAINPPIIELSVPAKAILFGEHAVVYGKVCATHRLLIERMDREQLPPVLDCVTD